MNFLDIKNAVSFLSNTSEITYGDFYKLNP